MLLGLLISNLAIAKRVELNFEKNLVILSGETGAGKTIIMNAIALACGANADPDLIRSGEDTATVEVSFSLNESKKVNDILESKSLYEREDVLVIARTISRTRGKSLINGHLVSVRDLSDIGKILIDMHGQHEVQSLLDTSNHLRFLDKFGGKDHINLRDLVKDEIEKYHKVKELREELEQQDKKYREEIDFINFEINELEGANLNTEEEKELEEEEKILSNVKELSEITLLSEQLLSDTEETSIIKLISQLQALVNKGSQLTERLTPIKEQIESLNIELKEISRSVSEFTHSLVFDPGRLEYIEERLDLLSKLKLKYKKSIPELSNYLEELKEKVSSFNSLRDQIEELKKEESEIIEKIKTDAAKLSQERAKAAQEFTAKVEEQLKDLAMESARFKVALGTIDDENGIEISESKYKLMKDGIDTCEFLISANPGEDFKPLVLIASAGELSRVMLAIKYVIAQIDEVTVLAFDEVDAGIGGKTGERVAEKLKEISKYRQVICITHLPQIASLPGEHFVVDKEVHDGETFLKVAKLNEYERINEIARMISGSNITETTINQAKELLGRWK